MSSARRDHGDKCRGMIGKRTTSASSAESVSELPKAVTIPPRWMVALGCRLSSEVCSEIPGAISLSPWLDRPRELVVRCRIGA
eukprot:3394778-Pyramimonas_sp.AAC.1